MTSEQENHTNDNSDNEENVNMFYDFLLLYTSSTAEKFSTINKNANVKITIFQSCNKLNRFIKIYKDILPNIFKYKCSL